MEDKQRFALFEQVPVPKAVMKLAVPTILSSLVMVLYNLADTYFVGMLNDPIQNAAVTLAAPVMLAFNAVNNGRWGGRTLTRSMQALPSGFIAPSSAASCFPCCALPSGSRF